MNIYIIYIYIYIEHFLLFLSTAQERVNPNPGHKVNLETRKVGER